MGRPHIEFINIRDVEPQQPTNPIFAGAHLRMLSEDVETGAYTALAQFPIGWSAELSGFGRPVEVFGLAGTLELAGERLGEGCYAYMSPTDEKRQWVATGSTHALVMVEGEEASRSDRPVHVVDTATMRWQASLAPGLSVKNLRIDGETGDRSWISASCPRKSENRAEVHPTIEECLMLRGDCLLGRHGEMTPGAYFWRPPLVEHGPLCTRNGAMYFFRTKGGDFTTAYAEVPGWEEMVSEYFAREPYMAVDLEVEGTGWR